MTAADKNSDKSTGTPLTPPAVGNGLGITSQAWVTEARFIAFQEPKPWEIEGRKGTSYKIDVRVSEGTAFLKVDENVYKEMEAQGLQFGDKIRIIWGKATRNGEFRVLPVAWERM